MKYQIDKYLPRPKNKLVFTYILVNDNPDFSVIGWTQSAPCYIVFGNTLKQCKFWRLNIYLINDDQDESWSMSECEYESNYELRTNSMFFILLKEAFFDNTELNFLWS